MLLKEDTGSGGDVEAGAVRDNEEDEVLFDVNNFPMTCTGPFFNVPCALFKHN